VEDGGTYIFDNGLSAAGENLGSATAEWNHLFLGDSGKAQFGAEQDWVIFNDETDTDSLDIQVNNAANRTIKITNEGAGNANLTVDGTITASSGLIVGESASPTLDFNDSDSVASPADDNAKIYGSLTDTGDGTEDMDLFVQVQVAGTLTTVIGVDADGDLELGTASMDVKVLDDLTLHSSDENAGAVVGNIKHDSTIANMTEGGLRWYSGVTQTQRLIVDLDTDPTGAGQDDYVVAYDQPNGEFYLKADADSGGAPRWDQIIAPNTAHEIDMGAYFIELNVSNLAIGDGVDSKANAIVFTGGAGGVMQIGSTGVQLTGDSDGALTFLGLSTGNDEDLTLNLDDTANTWAISSSTGVNVLQLTADDIAIKLDSVDAQDTDWWIVVDADQGASSDDPLEIGNNATIGTSPIISIAQNGIVTFTSIETDVIDVSGAADLDIGSADVTDVTIITDGGVDSLTIGNNTDLDFGITINSDTNDFTLNWDEDNAELELTSVGDEDLVIDLDTATDNEIGISSSTGATQINFGTLNILTTGEVHGTVAQYKDGAADSPIRALNDTASVGSDGDPLVLTAIEMSGTVITNLGAGGALYFQLPAAVVGYMAMFNVDVAQNIFLKPPSGTDIYWKDFDDTGFVSGGNDKDVQCNSSIAIGDRVFVQTRKVASTVEWFAWSDVNACIIEP
jgi:hypothetical protein